MCLCRSSPLCDLALINMTIAIVTNDTFAEFGDVRLLVFSDNQIRTLRTNILSGLGSMTYLSLDND